MEQMFGGVSFGITLGSVWDGVGVVWEWFWDGFGIVLGSFLYSVGIVLELFGDRFGTVLR